MEIFSNVKLTALRVEKGFTREGLAEASGVPYGTLSHYEYGRSEPSLVNGLKLARALGVQASEFLVPEGDAPQTPVKRPRGRPKKADQ